MAASELCHYGVKVIELIVKGIIYGNGLCKRNIHNLVLLDTYRIAALIFGKQLDRALSNAEGLPPRWM